MHCIKANFDKVMLVLNEVLGDRFTVDGNLLRPGPKPLFTDMNVVALSMTAECMGYDSESFLFKILNCDYKIHFPHLISRRQYNDRRKSLFTFQNKFRELASDKLNELIEVFALDSMPIEICKMARMERNKIGKEDEQKAPDKGYCAAQDKYFYGYKIHAACSPVGVIQIFNITKASVHDNHYLEEVSASMSNCIIAGDKGYIVNPSDTKAIALKESGIDLNVPYRKNQKDKKPQLYVLKVIRKRIETVFSQLCGQFNMQRNYAKSFRGLTTRILAKVSGMTTLQYINKFINDRPVGQIKYAFM